MSTLLHKLSDRLNLFLEVVGSILLISLVIIIGAQVVARYVFDAPLYWSEELGRIIFVWVIFLGASIGVKRGSHLGLHFISEYAPEKAKRVISQISLVFCTIFFLIVFVEGISVSIRISSELTAAMQISSSWQYAAIPTGALFSLCHMPSLFLGNLSAKRGE